MEESAMKQFVVFRLGEEEYAFDVSVVREIHGMENIARVHRSAPYVEGVINLRGRLLTVVNLRKRFQMEPGEDGPSSRIVVVDAPDSMVGFLVDEVSEVIRIGVESIEKAPAYVTKGIEAEYIMGIAKQENRLITLVDPVKILELSYEGDLGGAKDGQDTRSG